MKPVNFPERRTLRRTEAEVRQKQRDKRSPEQQLAALDERLGKGKGAKKERARLKKEARVAKSQGK